MKKALKRHGSPATLTTDGLRSYKAAMAEPLVACEIALQWRSGSKPVASRP